MFSFRMTITRLTVVSLVAAALCAAATTPAWAGWYVEGSALSGTAALATTASVSEHFKLKASGVTIECSAGSLSSVSPEIKAPNTIVASSLTFNECSAGATCKLATKAIATVPLLAEATEQAYPEGKVVFRPKTMSTLATIKFEGETCSLAGTQPITGKFTTSVPTLQEEKTLQEFKATTTEASSELKLGGSAAELTGAASFKLSSGKKWELNRAAPPAPKVEAVDFTNSLPIWVDHQVNKFPEGALEITEYGAKNSTEWEAPGGGAIAKNWPIAIAREKKIKLTASFALSEATRAFLETRLEGEVTLTGETTVGGVALKFPKKLTAAAIAAQLTAHASYIETGEIESEKALPNKILYSLATITWKWSAKETGRANPFVQQLGTTTHNLYVTYTEYKGPLYLTLLDLATQGIEAEAQPPTEESVIAGIWKGFSHFEAGVPSVHIRIYKPKSATGELNRAGLVLWYYQDVEPLEKTLATLFKTEIVEGGRPGCGAFSTTTLLSTGEGRCGAWMDALRDTLLAEGVESTEVNIAVSFGVTCAIPLECVMLVKNWTFTKGEGEEPGEFPYKPTQLIDVDGEPGQGISNPPSFFIDHVLLKAGPAGKAALYDPSYGTGPFKGKEGLKEGEEPTESSVLKEYQTKSLAGFCAPTKATEPPTSGDCQERPAALELIPEKAFGFP